MYVQEPLVICWRSYVGERFKQGNGWQQITDASSPVGRQSRMRAT